MCTSHVLPRLCVRLHYPSFRACLQIDRYYKIFVTSTLLNANYFKGYQGFQHNEICATLAAGFSAMFVGVVHGVVEDRAK